VIDRRRSSGSEYVRVYGQTHVALSSSRPRASAEFYEAVLESSAVTHDDAYVQIEVPGAQVLTIFERAASTTGRLGSLAHFGFQLDSPDDVRKAVAAVRAAGGEIIEEGEFIAGEPYLFARDPDGYLFEVWYGRPR
jgi:catechol 2,3-dioxygenase-like lactoylglutathione lyase family enzyme